MSPFLLGVYLGLGSLSHSVGRCSVIGGTARQMSVALLALVFSQHATAFFTSACCALHRHHVFRHCLEGPASEECREDSHQPPRNMADPYCPSESRGQGHDDIYFSCHFISPPFFPTIITHTPWQRGPYLEDGGEVASLLRLIRNSTGL